MRAAFRSRLVLAAIVALAQLVAAPILPNTAATAQTLPIEVVPDRYIVVLEPAAVAAASVAAALDGEPGIEVTQIYSTAIRGFAAELDSRAVRELMADPAVAGVFPDVISQGAAQTTPPGIDRIDADLNPVVAGDNTGSVDVDVAVIDSGVADHADLDLVGGIDCTGTGSYLDDHGHGTHVAGTIAARDNTLDVVGVAPGARIWAVKVLHFDNFGSESEIICGLDWVAANAATIEVANMSIQGIYGHLGNDCAAHPYHQAICTVANAGVTIVVAAGNGDFFGRPANTRIVAPAQFNEVITVSAFYDADGKPGGLGGASSQGYRDDTMAPFSNFGADIDIAAPGVDVLSLRYTGGTTVMSGTSMASPHVAGAVALVRVQEGITSLNGIRARLAQAARKGPIPGDPDAHKEPALNVARLGAATISIPESGTVGQQIEVVVTECIPGSRLLTRFDGVFMGGATAGPDGVAVRRFTLPSSVRGTHTITTACEARSFTRSFEVQPTVRLQPAAGPVGQTVTVALRGFRGGESVLIEFDTGPAVRKPVRIVVSPSGAGNGSFVIPASAGGMRSVTATGSQGTTISISFAVQPTLRIVDQALETGEPAVLSLRGFQPGERVEFRWDAPDGGLIGTKTVTATGSGTTTVPLPAGASEGSHTIHAIGNQGTERQVTLSFSSASELTPTPAATEIATAPPTETAASPTETASPEPTATATVEVPTESPSETPTATATAIVEVPAGTPEP